MLCRFFYHYKVIIILMMEKHQEQYHRTIGLVLALKKKLHALKHVLNYSEDRVIIYIEFINN